MGRVFLFACFICPVIFLFSCQKNNDTTDDSVYAGIYDSTFDHYVFSPSKTVTIVWDGQDLYGFGSDSIDVDGDGSFDLLIRLSSLNYDHIDLLSGDYPDPFPSCRLEPKNGLTIAVYSESYPIGLGQTGQATFADTLGYGTNISRLTSWRGQETSPVTLWGQNPGGAGKPSFGGWYYTDDIRYVGIKMNGRYGWIEVRAIPPENPVFNSFALKH
jgi:hypothetical protein